MDAGASPWGILRKDMARAYYNEIDPKAAVWLRELINKGLIASGDVDERSIEDVKPEDLVGYTQCHFFAGIGVWSYALRQAGWPDDRPVWTGSCPCQPFSSAGKGKGVDDERHLWPAFFWLISQQKPVAVFGEQVGNKAGLNWFDLVSTDLEGIDYTCGAVTFPACGIGSPHLRQRLYWVADNLGNATRASFRPGNQERPVHQQNDRDGIRDDNRNRCGVSGLANDDSNECDQEGKCIAATGEDGSIRNCAAGGMANIVRQGLEGQSGNGCRVGESGRQQTETPRSVAPRGKPGNPGPTNGFWRNADWLWCRDGKWRPVEPGTFPLAHGAACRVGRLRGYGNAIVAQQARIFIETFWDHMEAAG